jgi:hypothetical protein
MLMQVPGKLGLQYLGIGRHWRRVTRIVEMNCAISKAIVATLAFQNHVRRLPAGGELVYAEGYQREAVTHIYEDIET